MRQSIQQALTELAASFKDRRLHLFDISIKKLDDKTLSLGGRLLDEAHLAFLRQSVADRFPALRLDTSSISVLRRPENPRLKVITNLTGLYNTPSFLNPLVSELVYGTELEVLGEHERWVFTRQNDGYLGWVFAPYLGTETRPEGTHLVLGPSVNLYVEPASNGELASRVMSGTTLNVEKTEGDWAFVNAHKRGWIPMSALRALDDLPKTAEERRAAIIQDARQMMGVPYLWGGCTGNGIDCSGFSRLLHRWVGLEIPRDADLQHAVATPIDRSFEPGDLLFFSEREDGGRGITHVGVSLGGWKMIHSSRSNNGVYIDDVQKSEFLRSIFVSAGTFIS